MQPEEIQILAGITKYILLPAIGFLAGFSAKWYLQDRKSRDELLQALATKRADAVRELWAITTLPPEISELDNDTAVPSDPREKANSDIMEWYTQKGGALFLSWQATQLVFELLDTLRCKNVKKRHLKDAVTALRTRLKLDCGIYSFWDARRQLVEPETSPWPASKTIKND